MLVLTAGRKTPVQFTAPDTQPSTSIHNINQLIAYAKQAHAKPETVFVLYRMKALNDEQVRTTIIFYLIIILKNYFICLFISFNICYIILLFI
jgi:hypothetical protein